MRGFETVTSEHIDGETLEYVRDEGKRIIGWVFYLRCFGQCYHPCDECQEKLNNMIAFAKDIVFESESFISLSKNNLGWSFWLAFAQERFVPCGKCQNEVESIFKNSKHFIVGNRSYDPPVELNNVEDIDDESWVEVERREATNEEKGKLEIW